MKTLSPSLSRREKLLLGLLTSTLVFSASFSYGAVNSSKVDSIMQTINTAANNFSTQTDRDTYYQRVYTGLADAVALLITVQNNVGAMIGTAPVTVPPIPPTGGANPLPVTITNPIADYPIPSPCPAGVKIQKELMGKVTGAWKSTAFDRAAYPPGLIFKFRIDTVADMKAIGMITVDGEAAASRGHTVVRARLSPYPCDFPTAETWLQPPNDVNTDVCANVGGNIQYGVNTTGFKRLSKSTAGGGACNLKIGETYYLNIQATPSIAQHDEHHIGVPGVHTDCNRSDMACALLMEDKGLDATPTRPQYWGIYNTFEEYAATRLIQNNSSENPETLRQKVINDYKTKGMNTDGATGVASNPSVSTVPFVNYCPAGINLFAAIDVRHEGIAYPAYRPNFPKAHVGQPIVIGINVPQGYSTEGVKTLPRINLTAQDGYYDWNGIGASISTNPCEGRPPLNDTRFYGYGRGTINLYTPDDADRGEIINFSEPSTRRWTGPYEIIPGQMNYITIWGQLDVPMTGHTIAESDWGVMFAYYNMRYAGGNGTIQSTYDIRSDVAGSVVTRLFQPGLPTAFPTGSTPHTVNGDIPGTPAGLKNSPGVYSGATSSPAPSTRVGPWENVENIFCPDTLANAQKAYPSANRYWWTNVVPGTSGATSNSWWNVKDKNKLTDESLPATCTTGKEFIKHTTSYHCDRYVCRN